MYEAVTNLVSDDIEQVMVDHRIAFYVRNMTSF